MIEPLESARLQLGLSMSDLWWRYFALGGMSSELEVEAILSQALIATTSDRDVLALALHERSSEIGPDHSVPDNGAGGP